MTLNTTRSNVCHIYLTCVPEFQTLLRIAPWNLKNWKCTVLPQNYLEHLPVKITLNTLSACTRGPYFGPLLSKTSHLRDTRLMKSELYRMTSDWPQMYNVPCSDYALTNKGSNFLFSRRAALFKTQRFRQLEKLGMHRMTSALPWTHDSQDTLIH